MGLKNIAFGFKKSENCLWPGLTFREVVHVRPPAIQFGRALQ
jgi:hypothetical protein